MNIGDEVSQFIEISGKSMDHLYVDKIGRSHLHVDATSEHVSGFNNLKKTFIVLLSHLNRLNNTWVGSIFIVREIVASNVKIGVKIKVLRGPRTSEATISFIVQMIQ